jgi:TolB-like protein
MRKIVYATLLFIFGVLGAVVLNAQSTTHLSKDLNVFVIPLEGPDSALANVLNAKLISHLVKRGVAVVESVDNADAVLNGAGLIQSSVNEYGHVHYRVQAGMRLVNKDGRVLWADEISSSRYAQSASSSFADNVAKAVAQAISGDGQEKK